MLTVFLLQKMFVYTMLQERNMLDRRSKAGLSTHKILRRVQTHRQRQKAKIAALERDHAKANSSLKRVEKEVRHWKEKVEVSTQAFISLSSVFEWSCTDSGICGL